MTLPNALANLLRTTVVAVSVCAAFIPAARAADFTFTGPTNITGDSDISTFGTLVQAYNFNNAGQAPTINGVTFASFDIAGNQQSVTVGSTTLSTPSDSFFVFPGYGSASAPFANLSANYQTLLSSAPIQGADDTTEGTLTLTLTGLVIGQDYLFQTFANQSLNGTQGRFCFVRGGANFQTSATIRELVMVEWANT